MPEENTKTRAFSISWTDEIKAVPRNVKVEGQWFAIGADTLTLSNGKTVEGIKSQEELDIVLKAYPAFKNYIKGEAKSRLDLVKERIAKRQSV